MPRPLRGWCDRPRRQRTAELGARLAATGATAAFQQIRFRRGRASVACAGDGQRTRRVVDTRHRRLHAFVPDGDAAAGIRFYGGYPRPARPWFRRPPPSPSGYSLPGVAAGMTALLRVLAMQPVLLVGHQAAAGGGSSNVFWMVPLGRSAVITSPERRLAAVSREWRIRFSDVGSWRLWGSRQRHSPSTGSRPSGKTRNTTIELSSTLLIDAEGLRFYARLAGNQACFIRRAGVWQTGICVRWHIICQALPGWYC